MASNQDCRGFGEQLYEYRSERGMTQSEVAARAGLQRGYYSQLENSKKGPPPPNTLARLTLGLRLDREESRNLLLAANLERCNSTNRAKELPRAVASCVQDLIRKANEISNEKIHRIEAILNEG